MSDLKLPTWAVPAKPREEMVVNHRIPIRDRWWRAAVDRFGLGGTPPSAPTLSRAEVWVDDDVLSLLWRTLAWGSGRYLRQNTRRLRSIADNVDGAIKLLTTARDMSHDDPKGAYAVLLPNGRTAIPFLGPSFFTKFLYFAGRGEPDHRCLILDRVVATTLRDDCDVSSLRPTGPWSADTYQDYCDGLAKAACAYHCAADEIELALFTGKQGDKP